MRSLVLAAAARRAGGRGNGDRVRAASPLAEQRRELALERGARLGLFGADRGTPSIDRTMSISRWYGSCWP